MYKCGNYPYVSDIFQLICSFDVGTTSMEITCPVGYAKVPRQLAACTDQCAMFEDLHCSPTAGLQGQPQGYCMISETSAGSCQTEKQCKLLGGSWYMTISDMPRCNVKKDCGATDCDAWSQGPYTTAQYQDDCVASFKEDPECVQYCMPSTLGAFGRCITADETCLESETAMEVADCSEVNASSST